MHGFGGLSAPFPGLRAFEAEEALLFYGRERHVAELLDRLGDSRFVAVTGTSGSGKSSVVRAGLRPALDRGYLVDASSRWRFATMRPGGAPIQALAQALADALGTPIESILPLLPATSAGLSQVVTNARLGPGESLLLIADQFEELFRFDVTPAQQGNAALFVNLLLEATERRDPPIYVVVTMRSEFLGRCSEFTGLAEAFNRSQYLVPRLTRDERREAIDRPLRLVGTEPTPALVQQVLNDAGDDPDQLPVMQHALLRTYREWERAGATGRIEQRHYDAVGGFERALDRHGDEMLDTLDAAGQKTAERLLRSLTVSQGGQALRRPRLLGSLYEICGAATPDLQRRVDDIVRMFAARDNVFLMLSSPELTPDTVVDITHESVIRKWKRLKAWLRDESRSAEWYADLSRDVMRYRTGAVSLWQDPELAGVQQRQREDGWNAAWANQYRRADDPPFEEVLSFLTESERKQAERRRLEEEQRDRELRHAQALAAAKRRQAAVLALLLVGVVAAALMLLRMVAKDRELAAAAATVQRLSSESQSASSRLRTLEAEQAALKSAAPSVATPADQARLQQLTQEIESAKAQAQGSQEELAKLKKNQDLNASDRGRLLQQIETLNQRLTQTTADRDRLQNQLNARPSTPPVTQQKDTTPANDDRVAVLQRQLDDERKQSADEIARLKNQLAAASNDRTSTPAPASNASVQNLTKAFSDGVRAYDLRNWQGAVQSMQDAIRMQGSVQAPKEVRMAGTRFVPFAPQSYLAASLLETKADCSAVAAALNQAANEPVPPDLRAKLQAARAQCPGK